MIEATMPRNRYALSAFLRRHVTAPHEEEFLAFYRAFWPRLVAALALAVPEGEDPEDVAQEAFARAYQRWPVVRSHDRPDAWLFLTAYRLATSLRRRLAVAARRLRPSSPTPVPELMSGSELEELLSRLPYRQRAALLLRHYYGFSTKETAAALRCREGTVKSLVSRARSALKDALAEEVADG